MKKICGFILIISSITCFAEIIPLQSVNIPISSNTGVDARNQSNNTGSDLSKNVGVAMTPGLTASFSESCMGSTSVGAGFAGGSLALGSTWTDIACVRRLDAREIKTLGDAEASKELMCNNKEIREAFKRVGRPCKLEVTESFWFWE